MQQWPQSFPGLKCDSNKAQQAQIPRRRHQPAGETVAEIIPFPHKPGRKPKKGAKRGTGKTLCKSGFHKWAIDQRKQFDVRAGRLVTIRRCERCGHTRTTLD